MALLGARVPIEPNQPMLRARRTAALARMAAGIAGIVLLLGWPALSSQPGFALAGFGMILATALVQLASPRVGLLTLEESVAASAAVLIVGLGGEHVNVVALLWLVAVVSGVLARGGRAHWVGRTIVLCGLLMPVAISGDVSAEYAAASVGAVAILLTSGRVTLELNLLLRNARLQADSAEALLLAGDIAQRVEGRGEAAAAEAPVSLSAAELADARIALAQLIEGEGLSMAVQPIVDIRTGAVHAYEALARFGFAGAASSPAQWFALAERLGARPALERACLREALALLPERPKGTALTVNLSAPVLLEARTLAMLGETAAGEVRELAGLIVEITEETLVVGGEELRDALAPLQGQGLRLAVDDMGAGYSGLRQITAVAPSYLKLDRTLCCGIDRDEDRAALVAALAGYAARVGTLLVAEGIESIPELLAVRRLGVPLVQGYRLARPGPPWPEVDEEATRAAVAASDVELDAGVASRPRARSLPAASAERSSARGLAAGGAAQPPAACR